MPTFTIGQLAARFGLSRSTLLYYDRIGLLPCPDRTGSNYRIYSERDRRRLEQICRYREVGLRLEEIREILDGRKDRTTRILESRLESLDGEISSLREQQRVIVELLKNRKRLRGTRTMDKEGWVALLRATGLDDDGMRRWHVEFERSRPRAHQDFLESLGIPPDEIRTIRHWSRPHQQPETGTFDVSQNGNTRSE